jgi:DNA-directed RNA polymerase specialized sigma24 family protein
MAIDDTTIEELLERAGVGEGSSVGRLLEYHRQKLRRMVAARLNSRLAARIDPSDVVQEALVPDRRVLELRHIHGLTIAAIASALEIGVGAAQMRYLRALERLRERLDGTGEDSRA